MPTAIISRKPHFAPDGKTELIELCPDRKGKECVHPSEFQHVIYEMPVGEEDPGAFITEAEEAIKSKYSLWLWEEERKKREKNA